MHHIKVQTVLQMSGPAEAMTTASTPLPDQGRKPWEFLVALLALVVSGVTMYRSEFRGANTKLTFGPLVQFLGPGIIGLNCSFGNEGPAMDTLTYVAAEVEDANQAWKTTEVLRPIWLSVSEYRWTIEKGLQERYTKQAEFTAFVPVVVPGKNRENRTIWFRSDNRSFKFNSGEYRVIVRAYGTSPADLRTEAVVDVRVSAERLKTIVDNPDSEVSIPIKPWVGTIK